MSDIGEQLPLDIGRWPIDKNRRLVPESVEKSFHLEEFYDSVLDSRVISLRAGGEEARSHEEMLEERMPVFSALYKDSEVLLLVPEGSRTLHKTLPLIARDLESYSEIFRGLGSAIGKFDASFGLPEVFSSQSILDSFAFSHDEHEPFGGKIYLIPPYRLEPFEEQKNRDLVTNSVYEELKNSRYFTEEAAIWLMNIMTEAWQTELSEKAG